MNATHLTSPRHRPSPPSPKRFPSGPAPVAAGLAIVLLSVAVLLPQSATAQQPAPPAKITVVPGDTLAAIAQRYYGAAQEAARIAAANHISNPNQIRPGMALVLPPIQAPAAPAAPRRTMIAPGDTLGDLAERVYGSADHAGAIAKANGLADPDLIRPGDVIIFPSLAQSGGSTSVANIPSGAAPTAATNRLGKLRHVCVDPGHGGRDIGAVYTFTDGQIVREVDATLDIAKSVASRLRLLGYAVTMTRETDVDVALQERALRCNAVGAGLTLSIHLNGLDDKKVNGSLALYATPTDRGLAELMVGALQSDLFGSRAGVIAFGAQPFHARVLLFSRMPAVLLEPAFLTNPDEARALLTPASVAGSRRAQIAAAIEKGVLAYAASRE